MLLCVFVALLVFKPTRSDPVDAVVDGEVTQVEREDFTKGEYANKGRLRTIEMGKFSDNANGEVFYILEDSVTKCQWIILGYNPKAIVPLMAGGQHYGCMEE